MYLLGTLITMSVPLPDWILRLRSVEDSDRLAAVAIVESYLELILECTKDEASRRIEIIRSALEAHHRNTHGGYTDILDSSMH
jgi:hypothetical protein